MVRLAPWILSLATLCAAAPAQRDFTFTAAGVDPDAPLDPVSAARLMDEVFAAWREHVAAGGLFEPVPELPAAGGPPVIHGMRQGDFDMPYALVLREPASGPPADGHPLLLCMHGGGARSSVSGPHAWDVNEREWRVQTKFAHRLYAPDGLYVVPRMADDRMGRWRHAHHQRQFDDLIEMAIATLGVDPDRVYILGISQGGYGTDILAPFMADRFAAADAMAAGVKPERYQAENLRHVAFRTDVGENDHRYRRVDEARRFHAMLDALAARHPAGEYVHRLAIQRGRGHGIDYRSGLPWIVRHRRDPWPARITWTSRVLFGERRPAFYWLGLDAAGHEGRIRLRATLERPANAVHVHLRTDGGVPLPEGAALRVFLRDELLDLGRPVRVAVNGVTRHDGPVSRTLRSIVETTVLRGDPRLVFPSRVELPLGGAPGAARQ